MPDGVKNGPRSGEHDTAIADSDVAEQQRWRQCWGSIKNLGIAERLAPGPVAKHEYPTGPNATPTHVSFLFRLTAATKFDHFTDAREQVAAVLSRQHVLIERHVDSYGDQDLRVIKLTHEIERGCLPPNPHLDPELDPTTRDFAVRWAVINAFQDLDLPTPMFVSLEVQEPAGDETQVIKTVWKLFDGLTYDHVVGKAEQLREALKCEQCQTRIVEGTEYVELTFGGHAA